LCWEFFGVVPRLHGNTQRGRDSFDFCGASPRLPTLLLNLSGCRYWPELDELLDFTD
jgi:hypothetical protein